MLQLTLDIEFIDKRHGKKSPFNDNTTQHNEILLISAFEYNNLFSLVFLFVCLIISLVFLKGVYDVRGVNSSSLNNRNVFPCSKTL